MVDTTLFTALEKEGTGLIAKANAYGPNYQSPEPTTSLFLLFVFAIRNPRAYGPNYDSPKPTTGDRM